MKTEVPECKIIFHQVLFILSHRLVMPLAKLLFSKITSVQNFEFIAIVSKTLYFLTLTLNLPVGILPYFCHLLQKLLMQATLILTVKLCFG